MRKFIILILFLNSISLFSQNDTIIIDQIVARIGDEIILQSSVEAMYAQWLAEGNSASPQARCMVFEKLLLEKLLVNQAKIDSIEVTESELDMQVDSRVEIFVMQMGGQAELESYLNKSIFEIKEDLKKVLKDQLVAEKMKQKIVEEITATPAEVAEYYKTLNQDSLPLIDITYEFRQIIVYPNLTVEEEAITLDKMQEIRQKIVNGERKFESMARMYSEDQQSQKNGGEIGFLSRGELDPEYAKAAFSLDVGEVSEIIKSQFGYHIIQLIERRGERVNTRHILIKPIIPVEAQQRAVSKADSLLKLINEENRTFKEVAAEFSEDKDTKNNGGLVYNQMTGSSKFTVDELPFYQKYDLMNMENGEISKPIVGYDATGNTVIRIYYLESKTPAHVANMKDDYLLIQDMAVKNKSNKVFDEWVKEQQSAVYINIDKQYHSCKFKYKNWVKNNN